MHDRHGRYHSNRTNILCSPAGNTHRTAHSPMQASRARQTPNDLRPKQSNKNEGLGDPIRDLNRLPDLCNFSPIIDNLTVCDFGYLLSCLPTGHITSTFTGGHYNKSILDWLIIVTPRQVSNGIDWRTMQAHRWLKLGMWTFDLVPHRPSPRATMAWTPHHLNLCCLGTRDLPGDFQSHLVTALEAPAATPAISAASSRLAPDANAADDAALDAS